MTHSSSGDDALRGRPPAWIVWTAIAWLAGFLLFFNSFTLPNSQPPTSRADVWRFVPIQYLNLIDPPDNADAPKTNRGTARSSGWRHLPQRFDAMAVAAIVLAGGWACGRLLLRAIRVDPALTSLERFVFAAGLGLGALSLLTLGCGLAGFLNRWLFGGLFVAAIIGETACRFRRNNATIGAAADDSADVGGRLKWICLLAAVPFLLAIGLGAMLPSFDFDVKEYHLQGPKEFFQNGRIGFLPHNVYTSFPFLTEMLSLLGMVLRDDWERGALAGKAVLACFAPLTSLGVYAAGRRWFGATAGCLAALFHVTTPWTYRISIIAYAEGGLTFFLFAALFAVMLGIRSADKAEGVMPQRMFLLAGLFAGSAMACKYPGVVQVVIPLGLAAVVFPRCTASWKPEWWKAGLRYGGAFAVGTVIAVGPWLLKNTVETGNPVYPLMWSIFGGRDWDAELNARWKAAHSPDNFALSDLANKFVDVVARSDWQTPLLFAFAPLALLVGRWKAESVRRKTATASSSNTHHSPLTTHHSPVVTWLWAYVVFLFLAWWGLTHRIDRFWVPMVPVVALLAGAGAAWCADRAWSTATAVWIAASVVFNLAFITTPLCGYNAYLIDHNVAIQQAEDTAPGVRFMNAHLPNEAKVLCVGEAQVFDARRDVLYNTVFDRSIFEDWFARPVAGKPVEDWPLRPAGEIRESLNSAGVTHVYVNWQEVLRYRRTYGYTQFVAPQRFATLVRIGVLEPPLTDRERTAYVPWDALSRDDRREVERWGPSLRTEYRPAATFQRFQVFPVRVK